MAELLIFMRNVQGDDVYRTAKLPKRGDVITVQEDGWPWGTAELGDPMFRIVAFAGEPVSTFAPLLSNEPSTVSGDRFADLTNTRQFRGFWLDIDVSSLPTGVQNFIKDGARTRPILSLGLAQVATFLGIKKARAPIADPAVIGADAKVIG